LQDAIDDCRGVVESKGLTLSVNCDPSLPTGHFNPFYLSELFRTLTECVTADQVAGDTLSLLVRQDGRMIVCDLCPSGLDPEGFHGAVDQAARCDELGIGIDSLPLEVADELHRADDRVRAWGGTLRIVCSDDFRIAARVCIRVGQPSGQQRSAQSEPVGGDAGVSQ
jgi:hypothetical protein